MPTIYMNDGLVIRLNYNEKGHNKKHVHVFYHGQEAVYDFNGEQLAGNKLPKKKEKEVKLYLSHHRSYLEELWKGHY